LKAIKNQKNAPLKHNPPSAILKAKPFSLRVETKEIRSHKKHVRKAQITNIARPIRYFISPPFLGRLSPVKLGLGF